MIEYRGPSGDRRLWYEPSEIESITADELRRAGLLPDPNQEDLSVDVEAFIESYLGLPFDLNASLDPSVLGVTDFVPGKKPKISVNRDLTGSALEQEDATPGLVGRWRATVAHEACHVLFHGLLFELDDLQLGMFSPSQAGATHERLMRCLKRDVGFNHQVSDWREVQANMGMGALLMPRSVFLYAVDHALSRLGISAKVLLPESPSYEQVTAILAKRFCVSKQAARIRLASLRVVQAPGQSFLK